MRQLWHTATLDIVESLRARWFLVYSIIFGSLVALLFVFGLTESRILGFTGLSRLLVTYIQLCMAVLPIFILITTVRSVAGDREAGVIEYLLSLPVPLAVWFWGKMLGRFLVVFSPVFLAMLAAAAWGWYRELDIPWGQFAYYTALLVSLSWCFLGIGMLISSLTQSSDIAQGTAFMVWLVFLLFIDLILLGLLMREGLPAETVVALAIANPLQSFRTAAFLLFDPQLVLLGATAYVILDAFGRTGYMVWALLYPVILGTVGAFVGYWVFRRGDLV